MSSNETTSLRPAQRLPASGRDGRRRSTLPIRVLTLSDEVLTGEALASVLGRSKIVESATHAGRLEDWQSAGARSSADAAVWFGSCADAARLEIADAIRWADECTAMCLVTERVDLIALRSVIRRGADRLGVVLRTPKLEPTDVLKSLVQLATGHVTLSPEILELLVGDAGVESDYLDALSPDEHDVLRLLASGLRNREIARRLGAGEKVVERQVTRIFGKLGLRQDENHAMDRRVMAARMFVLHDQANGNAA